MLFLPFHLTFFAAAAAVNAVGHQPTVYDFAIPTSNHTVDVKMISAISAFFVNSSKFFADDPDLPHANVTPLAGYAFLLEHPDSGRRVLFDLGIRKDFESLSPFIKKTFTLPIIVEKDVPDQLVEGNVTLESIDTVIWSHSHFDHCGDMTKIPNTTHLLVGPGTLSNPIAYPGYPADPNSWNLETDFQGHNITEIVFDDVKIAGQKSHDFFGDGSMYLLNMPGHVEGHLSALVRVTANPSTFILLAGDVEHHPGILRPSPGVPLTDSVVHTLPRALEQYGAPEYSDPFGLRAPQNESIHQDAVTAGTTTEKLKRFDSRNDVWVILSHDGSLNIATPGSNDTENAITLFPAKINDWAKKGWKEQSRFAFLDEANRVNIWVNVTA